MQQYFCAEIGEYVYLVTEVDALMKEKDAEWVGIVTEEMNKNGKLRQQIATLKDELAGDVILKEDYTQTSALLVAARKEIADLKEVHEDHHRLVRELDVLINREDGAAKQASLCDLESQLNTLFPNHSIVDTCRYFVEQIAALKAEIDHLENTILNPGEDINERGSATVLNREYWFICSNHEKVLMDSRLAEWKIIAGSYKYKLDKFKKAIENDRCSDCPFLKTAEGMSKQIAALTPDRDTVMSMLEDAEARAIKRLREALQRILDYGDRIWKEQIAQAALKSEPLGDEFQKVLNTVPYESESEAIKAFYDPKNDNMSCKEFKEKYPEKGE